MAHTGIFLSSAKRPIGFLSALSRNGKHKAGSEKGKKVFITQLQEERIVSGYGE